MSGRKFRDDNNGYWLASLISRLIIRGTVGGVGYAKNRRREKKDAEFMRVQYPQIHQQVFGMPPQSCPSSRAEAVDMFYKNGQVHEGDSPGQAIRCYQMALMVSDNAEDQRNIKGRIDQLSPMLARPAYPAARQPVNPELMAMGDFLVALSEQGRPAEPYWQDL